MSDVIMLAGSPSAYSKSSALLEHVRAVLVNQGLTTTTISVRDLPAEDLLLGRADTPSIQNSLNQLQQTTAIVIATPIYKAAYSGLLKTFLDLLPQKALIDKIILPLATGGSPLHALAIDYTLKPVLAALGASHILDGVYVSDSQIITSTPTSFQLEAKTEVRLQNSLQQLLSQLPLAVPA